MPNATKESSKSRKLCTLCLSVLDLINDPYNPGTYYCSLCWEECGTSGTNRKKSIPRIGNKKKKTFSLVHNKKKVSHRFRMAQGRVRLGDKLVYQKTRSYENDVPKKQDARPKLKFASLPPPMKKMSLASASIPSTNKIKTYQKQHQQQKQALNGKFKFNPTAAPFSMMGKTQDLFSRLSPEWKGKPGPPEVTLASPASPQWNERNLFTKLSPRQKGVVLLVTFPPGRMGVKIQNNTVADVFPGTQAESLGVCVGWQIVSVNGEKMPKSNHLINKAIDKTYKRGKETHILFCTNGIYQQKRGMPSLSLGTARGRKISGRSLVDEQLKKRETNQFTVMPPEWRNTTAIATLNQTQPQYVNGPLPIPLPRKGLEILDPASVPKVSTLSQDSKKIEQHLTQGKGLEITSEENQIKGCNPKAEVFVPKIIVAPIIPKNITPQVVPKNITPHVVPKSIVPQDVSKSIVPPYVSKSITPPDVPKSAEPNVEPKKNILKKDSKLGVDLFSSMSSWKGKNVEAETTSHVPPLSLSMKTKKDSSKRNLKDQDSQFPEMTDNKKENDKILVLFQPGNTGLVVQKDHVTEVQPGTQAERAGIELGWEVISINGQTRIDKVRKIKDDVNASHQLTKPTNILFCKKSTKKEAKKETG